MDNKIIQSMWIGNELSALERLCINSYLKNDHEFHLYAYEDIKNIPDGTVVKDAGEIIPAEEIFLYSTGTYSVFADWFRWKLLYEKGGFWVDMDQICIKHFDFDTDLIFAKQTIGSVAVGVLGFPPKHELCAFMENICENPNYILPYDSPRTKWRKIKRKLLRRRRQNVSWGETGGPVGFTQALEYFKLIDLAKPFTYFYPIPHYNWDTAFDDTFANDIDFFSNTYAVHLWNDMMRHKKGFDKNGTFPQNSLFEQLKAKYL